MRFTDLETARAARGLRLVVLAGVPSPWSEAARNVFRLKGLEFLVVRTERPGDAVRAWTTVHNAPVAMYDDEPPRSGWAEILALAERLQPDVPLVPADPEARCRMYGLSHELMSEGGLVWCGRLITIDASIKSDGRSGFSVPVARYLASRYGYAPDRVDAARDRIAQVFAVLHEQLRRSQQAGGLYYFGEQMTALDIYCAAAMNIFAPLPHEQCPMHPVARTAFEWLHRETAAALPPALIAHRDFMHERHLGLPVQL